MGDPTKKPIGKRSSDSSNGRGAQAPQHQNSNEHPPGAPAIDADRAGNFQQPITPEKQAESKPDDVRVEAQSAFLRRVAHLWPPHPPDHTTHTGHNVKK